MGKILLPGGLWVKQPQYPVAIDKNNPLSNGFTSFLYPVSGKFHDAVSPSLLNGTATAVADSAFPGGRTKEFNGTTSNINYGDVESVNFPGAYSFFVLFRPDAQTGARREMLLAKDNSAGRQFTIELNPDGLSGSGAGQTGAIGHTRFVAGGSYFQRKTAANVLTNGKWYSLLIGSTDGSTDIIAYLNGVSLALVDGGGVTTGLMQNTATALTAGMRAYGGAEDYFQGGIAAIGIANVAPSALLAKALFENPFQLLQKPQRRIYVDVAASGTALTGQNIPIAQGSMVAAVTVPITGQSSTIAQGTVTVATGVSAALTGQSLAISQGTMVAAVVAAVTGQSLSLSQGSVVAVSGGVVVLTGQSLSIAQGGVSAAIVGALSGQGVSVAQGSVTSGIGQVLAGQSLSVTQGSLSAVVSKALTGQSATIAQGTISVPAVVTTATTLIITKITGTFAAGSIKVGAAAVGTCTGTQVINGGSTAKLRAQYTNLAADVYRALITVVPGSGSILGVWMYNDVVYAFRNVANGLTAAMYKSTSSGWSLVALGRELSYTSGGVYTIAVGDTITGNTSLATAVITAITVQTGTLAAGTAAGRIIFASQTGTFQTETLNIGANINVADIAGNSTAITFAVPSGRFEFCTATFGSSKMYGVDGKNRGFEFDGTTFVPIATGMALDTPKFVREHKNHLFYAFAGSAQHSGIGTPYTWTIVSGAAELAMGDTITGFQRQVGAQTTATMAIFTRNNIKMLYGTSSTTWQLNSYKEEAGAYAYTIQQLGLTMMLDDRGVTSLETSQNFGNFADSTLTKHIQTWLVARRSVSIASCVARDKNQYRLFFTDGSALYVTMDNGKPAGMMPVLLTNTPTCICSLENNVGNERIYFGDASGYVHQMDIGTSFDGAAIEFYLDLAYNNLRSPRIIKSFKSAVLEVSGSSYSEFSFGYSLGYGSAEISQPANIATVLSLTALTWDSGVLWDSGAVWDGVSLLPSAFSMGGEAENISIKILGSSDHYGQARFSGVLINYVVRRALR